MNFSCLYASHIAYSQIKWCTHFQHHISVNSGNKYIIEISFIHHHYPGRFKLELCCGKSQTSKEIKKSFHMSKLGFYTTDEAAVCSTSSLSHRCCNAVIIHTTRPSIHTGGLRVTLNQPTYLPGGTGVFCPKTRHAVLCTCPKFKLKQSLACVGHIN